MVQFLQTADAVRGDPGEHVLSQHQAPQRPLQPGEGQGGDGVEVVIADLQTPGSWTVGDVGGGNNHICLRSHPYLSTSPPETSAIHFLPA